MSGDGDVVRPGSGEAGPPEEKLQGGNTTAVTRVGDTVRRAGGPWSPTIHALLRHVRAHGVSWVPVPLGFTDDGREILSHLPGVAAQDPMPDWVWSDATLAEAARRLRQLHDATTGFDPTDAVWWIDAHEPREVVCHNDFAPYNFVFDTDHRLSGVIDWDTASPGPRVWDAAYLAYRLVPLGGPQNTDLLASEVPERRRRLALLTRAYGDGLDPVELVATAVTRLIDLADFTERRADEGADHVRSHVAGYRADAQWLSTQTEELVRDLGREAGPTPQVG